MIRLIAVAFTLALATSAQAMPLTPIQPNDMVTKVREACGAGRHRVGDVCVSNVTARQSAGTSAGVRLECTYRGRIAFETETGPFVAGRQRQ